MATGLKLVAVKIAQVGAIVVLVVVGTRARRAFVLGSKRESARVEGVDRPPGRRQDGHVSAVPCRGFPFVKGQADEQTGPPAGVPVGSESVFG